MATSPSSTRSMSWFYNLVLLVIIGGMGIFILNLPFWLMLLGGPIIAGIIDKLIGAEDPIDVRLQSFFLYEAITLAATVGCWFFNASGGIAFSGWALAFIMASAYDLFVWKPRLQTVQPPRPRW